MALEVRKVGLVKRRAETSERRTLARYCCANHLSKPTCTKHGNIGPLLEFEILKKCASLWREAHVQVKMLKAPHAWTTFEGSDVVLCFSTVPKVTKMSGFSGSFKNDGRRATCEEDLRKWISRGRRSPRDMLGGQGPDFLREVALWSVKPSGLLERFCVTDAELHMSWLHFFVAGAVRQTDGMEKLQDTLARGRRLRAQTLRF